MRSGKTMPHAAAVLAALFVWWFATGAILWANGVAAARRPAAVAATALAALGLLALWLTRDTATAAGAYAAFLAAIAVWAWHELMFLTGRITGPRTTAAPPATSAVGRFRAATEVVLYHEVALALTLALVAALTAGGTNRVGLVTFAALWALRLSAKLNVFLGVRNLSQELLPASLAYVGSYFRRRECNWLLPFSVAFGTGAAVLLLAPTWAHAADDFAVAGGTLTATLVLLGVAEHLFMVAPFEPSVLWRWATAARSDPSRATQP